MNWIMSIRYRVSFKVTPIYFLEFLAFEVAEFREKIERALFKYAVRYKRDKR